MAVTILAIESSCDDTSVAVLRGATVLSNITASQAIHSQYGGVVPEVASRAHEINIVPTVQAALHKAGIEKTDIEAVAFTRGPGLMGSLLVGVSFAKSLALALGVPLLAVNHMQAHVLAHFIDEPIPPFPFLCLTVSGGHTQIVLVRSPLDMEVLGETIDDAAGEAFDKIGKILGLPYPAGPHVDKLAALGNPVFKFPEPRIPELNFSFSGLKTSVMYFLRDQTKENPEFISTHLNDICASVQDRIVSILLNKLKMAAKIHHIHHIAIAGGVSANRGLRKALEETGKKQKWTTYIPQFQYCTDNAAMIGTAARFLYEAGIFADQSAAPLARWHI
jgi:N6-L-threonylcarbamoyladenine synthase